jgi:hypothetical protein
MFKSVEESGRGQKKTVGDPIYLGGYSISILVCLLPRNIAELPNEDVVVRLVIQYAACLDYSLD